MPCCAGLACKICLSPVYQEDYHYSMARLHTSSNDNSSAGLAKTDTHINRPASYLLHSSAPSAVRTDGDGGLAVGAARIVLEQLQQRLRAQALSDRQAAVRHRRRRQPPLAQVGSLAPMRHMLALIQVVVPADTGLRPNPK